MLHFFCLRCQYSSAISEKIGIAGNILKSTSFPEKNEIKIPNENEEKQRRKNNFLFQNSTIMGFILCERLNLGDSKYKYIA